MYNRSVGKTFHFLAGLHRSGNTVLSSILNQHPDIYSASLGPVCEYLWRCHRAKLDLQLSKTNNYPERSDRLISRILDIYYEDVHQPIVMERDKNWAHPANIEMIRTYINVNPKIVFTTRPILEILASFVALDTNVIVDWMKADNFQYNNDLTLVENCCDYLMGETSTLTSVRHSINSLHDPVYSKMIHVVKYQDLLDSPQEIMNGIYNFLEVEEFQHNFKNIKKIEIYNETAGGLPVDLHKVRKELKRSEVTVEKYLTPYVIDKYGNLPYC